MSLDGDFAVFYPADDLALLGDDPEGSLFLNSSAGPVDDLEESFSLSQHDSELLSCSLRRLFLED